MAKTDQRFGQDRRAPSGAPVIGASPEAPAAAPSDGTRQLARDLLFELIRFKQGIEPAQVAKEAWDMARAFDSEGDGAVKAQPNTLKLSGAG